MATGRREACGRLSLIELKLRMVSKASLTGLWKGCPSSTRNRRGVAWRQTLQISRAVNPVSRNCDGDCHREEIPCLRGTTSVAETSRCHGNGPMIIVPKKDIPQDILSDSVLAHVAAAYSSVERALNEKLGALRLAASSYPHYGVVPRPIRIKSPHSSVSTERSCTEPSSRWFR